MKNEKTEKFGKSMAKKRTAIYFAFWITVLILFYYLQRDVENLLRGVIVIGLIGVSLYLYYRFGAKTLNEKIQNASGISGTLLVGLVLVIIGIPLLVMSIFYQYFIVVMITAVILPLGILLIYLNYRD